MDDHALQTTALSVLKSTGYPSLARLGCRVDNRTVELYGVVKSFYLKQLAQEALRRVQHVKRIENKVDVASQAATYSMTRT
jgi:hypothetical protein